MVELWTESTKTIFKEEDFIEVKICGDHFYDKTFDDIVYSPNILEEDKFFEQCVKYPVIFAEIPNNLKRKYNTSKNTINMNASALGLAKIEHDDRIKKINNIMDIISDEYKDLKTMARARRNIGYQFATYECPNGKINLRVVEWVYDKIEDLSSSLGLYKYELGICSFFAGIQDAKKLNPSLKNYVNLEVTAFWEVIDKRLDRLERGDL